YRVRSWGGSQEGLEYSEHYAVLICDWPPQPRHLRTGAIFKIWLVRGRAALSGPTSSCLFDHLVGGHEQFVRHSESEHPGSRGVDDELELARLQNRQIRGLRALKYTAGIDAELTPRVRDVGCVAHEPADCGVVTPRIRRGNRVARRQVGQLDTPGGEE